MVDEKKKEEEEQLACGICMKDISADNAETFEVDDYVHHFCGLDCYSKWQRQRDEKKEEKKD